MENTAAEIPSSEKGVPIKTGQGSRKLTYSILAVGILFIVTLIAYFFLVANKPKETPVSEPQKTATQSTKKGQTSNTESVVYVTAQEGLNLREEASTSSLVVLLLPYGTELKVISKEGDWYFVEAQTKGFVSSEFVSSQKPSATTLLTFSDTQSPFRFLYPSVYKVTFVKDNNVLTFNFTGNESVGGFKVEIGENMATLGNYALKNYPQAQKGSCEPIRFGTQAQECEKVTQDSGTTFLLLVNTTLYKITYLKTEGGLLTDLNNLVFYSLHFD